MENVTYYFDFSIRRIGFLYQFDEKLIKYYAKLPRSVYGFNNLEVKLYNMFLNDERDVSILQETISKAIKIVGTDKHLLAVCLIRFIQGGIQYDLDKLKQDDWYMYYPYETLSLGKGVCSDKSLLLAKILVLLGFKVALFIHDKKQHMTVGILVPKGFGTVKNGNEEFAIIETTAYYPLGTHPDDDIHQYTRFIFPEKNGSLSFSKIFDLRESERHAIMKYGAEYIHANAFQKNILIKMKEVDDEVNRISVLLKQTYDVNKYNQLVKKHNIYTEYLHKLCAAFNQDNNT